MILVICFSVISILFIWAALARIKPVYAHCDTLDGPVVSAARQALEQRDVNLALVWVSAADEASVRQAFDTAMRKLATANNASRSQAEYEFFEHLVKVHRESEGETYEGLKPAGTSEEERLADAAVSSGNLDEVLAHITSEHSKDVVRHMFHRLREAADYRTDDLVAGRDYVAAYTQFIHAAGPAMHGEDLDEHTAHHHHDH